MDTNPKDNLKLDISCIENEPYCIGVLTQEVINLLGLNLTEKEIIIWKDRIKYIEKHKSDFTSEDDYRLHVESMPEIISNPDYVGIHPKGDSIQYIKKINKIMLVGIRIKLRGKLVVRSCYPISQSKLDTYIQSGTLIEFSK